MKLTKLVLDRFKSFKDRTVFDFTVSDNNKNIVLIWWDNWSWKTSLLEALNIALYWIDVRNIIKYFNNTAARENNWGCSLEIEYISDEWENIKIKRVWNAKWKYFQKEDINESMVNFFFSAEKNWLARDIAEDAWFEEIDAKIPQSVSEFFFFEWEKITDMASDDVPEKLKNSMEKIIWLEPINTLIYDLKAAKRTLLNKSIDIKSEDISDKKIVIDMKNEEYIVKQNELTELNKKLSLAEKQLEEKDREFVGSFWPWTDEAKKIKELDLKIDDLNKEVWAIDDQLTTFFNKKLPFCLLDPFFSELRDNLDANKEYFDYMEWHQRNKEIRNKIIEGLYKPKDVLWWNSWNDKYQDVLERKISEILNEKIKDKPDYEIEPIAQMAIKKVIDNQPNISEISEKQKRKNEILRQLKNYNWERDNINVSDEKENKRKILMDELNDLKYDVRSYKNQRTELMDYLKRLKSEIANQEKDYDSMREKALKSEKDRIVINRINNYLEALDDYKDELRRRKMWTLESNIEKMFKSLYNKWNVWKIEINPDNFSIQIYDLEWHRKYQRELSEWEKSLLSISLIWWLSKTSNLDLPIITDAPLSVLDKWHRNNVLQNYFPNASAQVIIMIKEVDLLPDSEWYKLIKDHIWKEYTLDFDKSNDLTTLKDWYFKN